MSYSLTNHACSHCGGRLLSYAGGAGVSGRINYLCSCCEASDSSMTSPNICYCGLSWRGSQQTPYRCVHKDEIGESPWLKDACGHSRWDVDSQQIIGMVSLEAERNAKRHWEHS
jgi:hypothetical protein